MVSCMTINVEMVRRTPVASGYRRFRSVVVAVAFAWFRDGTRRFLRVAVEYTATILIHVVQLRSVNRLLVVKSRRYRLKRLYNDQ